MSTKIEEFGKLREFLLNAMLGVRDGSVRLDDARAYCKLAERVTESVYAELKVAQVNKILERTIAELGKTIIT